MKILIADDEVLEREALARILMKGISDIQIVGLAPNGRIAVQLAEQHCPDLILMDIKMPGMDGLQAIQAIRRLNPSVKFVMVTAFDSFDYAQQAIRLQVSDYLLKPSKPAVILQTVGQVLEALVAERKGLKQQLEATERLNKLLPVLESDFVTQLLYDSVHESHLQEMMNLLDWEEQGPAFVLVCSILTDGGNGVQTVVYKSLKEYFREASRGWVGALSANQVPIIVKAGSMESFRAQSASLIRKLINFVSCYRGARVFIGIGGVYPKMSDIRHSYHEALLASTDLSIPVGYRHYSDLFIAGKASEPIFLEIQKRVLEEARRGRWAEVFLQLQRWVNGLEAEGCSLVEAQQRVQDILLILARFMEELGAKPDKPYYAFQMTSYTQLRSEVQRILHGVRRSVTEMQEQVGQDIFGRMKSFVLLNAHREISLDVIAGHFQISPFYVSRLFKEKFGTNYVDFLTDCRLEKAKELMTDEKKSLKEIAYEVGYHDPNYFSRVFKKSSGMAATEYRKDLLVRLFNNSPSNESV